MRKCLFVFLLFPFIAFSQGSLNMTLIANVYDETLPERSNARYNDIWGFKHANGTEVAIIGGMESIFFYDITVPSNPVLIYEHPVMNVAGGVNGSLWRDFKTYQNYAYASADEGSSGLLIFDLSQVPNSVTMVTQTNAFWARAHNIYIDEANARLYAAGTNTQSNGLKVLDLTNPANPTQIGAIPLNGFGGGYVHDVHVVDNIAYCSHGSLHKLTIYDMTNLSNITVVGSVENYQEAGYNHSSWVNADGNYLVMADETHGSDLKLVDITDPMDISTDDINTFYSELLGAGAPGASIAHNPFILGDLVFISYYHDGVQVFDISDPENIECIAYYDTNPDNTDYLGYAGCWGVYPYLPSGNIIASDQTYGLYVMQIENSSLDIDYLSFDAKKEGENVRLRWSVADAAFGNKFEIHRSVDGGINFEKIAEVKLGENQSNYNYIDTDITSKKNYLYRIDFIELDGKHIPSPIRSVTAGKSDLFLQVVNPVSDKLIIDMFTPLQDVTFSLFSIEGKAVFSAVEARPAARIELEVKDLVPGQYLFTAQWAGGSENRLIQVVR